MNTKSPLTLNQISDIHPGPLNRSRTVLVVIDAQEEYRSGRLPLAGIEAAILAGRAAIEAARASGVAIVHVFHRGGDGGLFDPTSEYFRPLQGFEPKNGEKVIEKSLPNSFARTELDQYLRHLEAKVLILVGFMTHVCIESTARAALDLDYEVRILAEATATRQLPSPLRAIAVSAESLHEASLAALYDRFAFPITHQELAAIQ